jgi:uncharacterized BrkB/YihY/UPF0761 family membrane protein
VDIAIQHRLIDLFWVIGAVTPAGLIVIAWLCGED